MSEHPSYVFCKLYRLVRAHRSHRWGRWFESNCHHHSAALVNQGLASFLPYSHVRDLSLLTACSTNEAMRRWHGFVAWRYGFFDRKSHGSVAVLEGERSDGQLGFRARDGLFIVFNASPG